MLELIIIVTDPFRPDRAMHAYTLLVVGGATLLTVMAQTAYSGPPDAHLADEGLARFPCEYQVMGAPGSWARAALIVGDILMCVFTILPMWYRSLSSLPGVRGTSSSL